MTKFLMYLIGFTFCLLLPRVGLACSCDVSHLVGKSEKSQVSYARKHADTVFSGMVTEILIDESSHTYEAKFNVNRSWKGMDSEVVSLFGGTICCFCQYEFKVGESYVIYANLDKASKRLSTSICHRTRPLADAVKDLKYLGKSKKAVNERRPPKPSAQPQQIVGREPRKRVSQDALLNPQLTLSRGRVNFYEAGSGQEVIRGDWFTLLFEVIQLDS